MDEESIVLDVDPRSVLAAIKQANTAVEGWKKGTVGAGKRMQKSPVRPAQVRVCAGTPRSGIQRAHSVQWFERMAEMLLKVNDRSRSSMERLTQCVEKQADTYGKTGVDRLIVERPADQKARRRAGHDRARHRRLREDDRRRKRQIRWSWLSRSLKSRSRSTRVT